MTNQETCTKSMSGGHRPTCIDYTARHRQEAAEQRQYQALTRAAQAAVCTYGRRTGSRLNLSVTPLEDLAAAAYIIMCETGQRPGETTADTMRRSAYEAVRRAVRDQQRHAHADTRDDHTPEDGAPDQALEAVALLDIIQRAGGVALLMVDGMDTRGIALTLGVSLSTAWRLIDKARRTIRQALDT